MEEVNADELPNRMNAQHTNQFIDGNEETDHNEFLKLAIRSPLVATPFPNASPIDANNSLVDRRKVITVEKNGTRFGLAFVTRSIMSSVFGRMPFAAERWRLNSAEDKYRFQSDNDRKMAREVWEKTCEAEQNQKVSWRDVYHKTHKKKNGEFVSERSKHFVCAEYLFPYCLWCCGVLVCCIYYFCVVVAAQENLDIALLDKYGEESSSYPEVDTNLWLDVAPHSKKGKIHGLGQGLQLSSGSPNSTSSACSAYSTTSSTTTPIIPQSQIDEAVSRAMAIMLSTRWLQCCKASCLRLTKLQHDPLKVKSV
ncbi:uncharacterized protein G2W53_017577 [Senna tora]|uniref:Uncharacterized protein n=1 Tax=Senna tora TaxID=362788 RepID=A0A834WMK3_9FABA|nr:uncharacterized protein G2W53_017577 [Senna tora]